MGINTSFYNIPEQLRRHALFCCWQYEDINGRLTKMPYYPNTCHHTKSNEPSTFLDFDSAVDSVKKGMHEGIGIGIFGDVCAIDIDDCVAESGELSGLATDIIRIMQSYTEYSPSGKGIHILFSAPDFQYDKERFYIMNRENGLEVYVAGATNKYVTVTGNQIGSYEFGNRTENLKAVLDKYMKRPMVQNFAVNGVNAVNSKRSEATSRENTNVSGDGMPERAFASKNGESFRQLWEGNWSGYGSQSEADLALCSHLAFWTQRDPHRMDELFRQSGLMRDKWNRQQSGSTYGDITIQKAIHNCASVAPIYQPRHREEDLFPPLLELDRYEKVLPSFPVEELPPVIADYVKAVSKHSQTSVDMAGAIALGVLAICLQGKYRIEGTPGYYEQLSLYALVIAEPGERKSNVVSKMTRCLYEYVAEYNREHKDEIVANQRKRERLQRQIDSCVEKLKRKDDEKLEELLWKKQDELAEMPIIEPLRLLADDASVEALTSLLAENDGRMGVVSSEAGPFDNISGRYSQKVNLDVWLKGHCGDPIMIDRKGRMSEVIEHPHLSAVLSIQPFVLGELMSNEKFNGRGLIARFLFCTPPSLIGERVFEAPAIPDNVSQQYADLVGRLLSLPIENEPKTLHLSVEATQLMGDYFSKHEKYLAGEGQAIIEWASKYIGTVLRIAGLLHVAKEENTLQVSKETIEQSIRLSEYFLAHAKYAYSLAGNDPTIKEAKFVLCKIKEKAILQIKKWELEKDCRSKLFKEKEDMLPALQLLERCGYIKIIKPEPRSGAGRKPDARILVNPLIYRDAVNAV